MLLIEVLTDGEKQLYEKAIQVINQCAEELGLSHTIPMNPMTEPGVGDDPLPFSRYRVGDWFEGIAALRMPQALTRSEIREMRNRPLAERLRLALTEIGTTYIKLGQILSTRADLVGPEIADELRKLQADVPADSPEIVQQTIIDELGEAPESLFPVFEPEAFSSASIGQVHRATLKDGQEVVVKIQHEGIQEKVRIDLEILMSLAKLLQKYVSEARAYQPVATANEFRRTLLRELDFTSERRNIEQFTRNFKEDSAVHVPAVHSDYCSRRVLTMEKLQGISGSKPDEIQSSGVALGYAGRFLANI